MGNAALGAAFPIHDDRLSSGNCSVKSRHSFATNQDSHLLFLSNRLFDEQEQVVTSLCHLADGRIHNHDG